MKFSITVAAQGMPMSRAFVKRWFTVVVSVSSLFVIVILVARKVNTHNILLLLDCISLMNRKCACK